MQQHMLEGRSHYPIFYARLSNRRFYTVFTPPLLLRHTALLIILPRVTDEKVVTHDSFPARRASDPGKNAGRVCDRQGIE